MIRDYVLIIGAMKCGTTTLFDHLADHAQIAAGTPKEPGYFAYDETWARGWEWYESLFDYDPNKHRYALEASTDYTKYPFFKDVAQRLKASAPRQFKLIYIMRHPLRRIESHARHAALTKTEMGGKWSERKDHSFDFGINPTAVTVSRYAAQLDVFSDYYDKGQLLLLTLEKLARERDEVLKKVFRFLEVDEPASAGTAFVSNRAESHLAPHSLWRKFHDIAALRSVVQKSVPRSIRNRIYETAVSARQPKGRFNLNADEERTIIDALTPDLVRLRDRYGIDAEKEWGIAI
jgi:hypothetical protein